MFIKRDYHEKLMVGLTRKKLKQHENRTANTILGIHSEKKC